MGVVVLGINGGFFPNSSSYTSFPLDNSSISRLPIVHFASNFAAAKKRLDFDGKNPRFSKLGACAHVTWICPKLNTGFASNSIGKKKSWDFNGRVTRFCASSTLEGHSASVQVIEKELKFSPMFNDYVKVMESVRTDRSKNSSEDAVGVSPKKRSMENVASSTVTKSSGRGKLGNRRKGMDAKNRKHGDGEGTRSGRESGWDLVERIMEKRTSRRSGDLSNAKARGQNGREVRSQSKDAFKNGREVRSQSKKAFESGGSSSKELYGAYGIEVCSQSKGAFESGREVRSQTKNAFESGGSSSKELYGTNGREVRSQSKDAFESRREARSQTKSTFESGGSSSKELHGTNGREVRSQSKDAFKRGREVRSQSKNAFESCGSSSKELYGTNGREVCSQSKDAFESGGRSSKEPYGTNGREVRSKSKDAFESDGSSSKEHYGMKVDGMDNGRVGFGRKKIHHNPIENIDINNMKTRMGWLYTSKVSLERRSSIGNEAVRKSDGSLVTKRTCCESGRFDESKAITEDEISRMDKRKDTYGTSDFEKDTDGTGQRHAKLQKGSRETKNLVSKTIEMQRWSNDKVQSARSVDFEERAAFRTFEEFTDVRNRPRVLRMELEERIQKLAKWLNATDVNMPEWQFSKIMHSANIKFTEHSILRVVQILGAFGNWKRALQVVEWLQTRERFKAYKTRYIYTSVLDVLGKAKRPIEALNVFYAMRQELSSYPDLAAYHCIAVTLGQAGLMKELFDVIDCMRAVPEKKFKLGPLQKWDPRVEPDLVVYNAVLNACVQQKQWEGAFWVLQQFKERNIRPTNTTYGLIMETMLASEKYNLVHEVFKKVEKTSIPNALNYKVLVNTLWREGRTDEAVQAVKDMERRGVVGSASLFYDLARCLCSAGRCKEALLQINKICKVAKKPLVVTYTGLIQACLDSGSMENAAYIFSQMHKFCSPNTVTCNIMLKSYIKHGMYEEAKDLFWKIVDGSHQIRSKVDSDQRAVPDKYTFNTMMDACASTNNWDDFERTYKQMLHHGYHFDSKRHLRLILDASRAGKSHVIETTWDHLIRFGRAPPPPLMQERFCIRLQEDNHLAAISFIRTHRERGMQAFSRNSWLKLLQSNIHRIKKDTIYNLAHQLDNLVAGGDQPCLVYRSLLDACRDIC